MAGYDDQIYIAVFKRLTDYVPLEVYFCVISVLFLEALQLVLALLVGPRVRECEIMRLISLELKTESQFAEIIIFYKRDLLCLQTLKLILV